MPQSCARPAKCLANTISLSMVLVALLVTCLVGLSLYWVLNAYVLAQAEDNIQSVLLAHKGIHHYIQRNTHPEFYKLRDDGELPRDFYSPELLSSSFMLRNVHTYFNEERVKAGLAPLYYKMAALNPRNPVNQADDLERQLIAHFNQKREETHYSRILEIDGQKYLYFAQPFLPNDQACLKCHGKRQDAPRQLQARYPDQGGFDEQMGAIRAIESVRAPLDSNFKAVHLVFAAVLAGVGAFMMLLLLNRRLTGVVRERTEDLEQELTHRQEVQAALTQSQDYLSTLVESSMDGILTTSLDRKIVSCNKAFTDLYGYRSEEVIGQSTRILFPSDESYQRLGELFMPRVMSVGHWQGEWEFIRKDGSIQPVDLVISVHRGPEGQAFGFVAIHRDISQRRQAEREKDLLEAQLRQAQKMEAVGTLAGGVAHDFNNMLAVIMGFAELAASASASGQDPGQDLQQILMAAGRARDLVQQILTYSRKVEPQRRPINLNQELNRGVAVLRSTLPKNIDLNVDLAPDLWNLEADPSQMNQVLMNLATNASQAMPQGGRLTIATHNAKVRRLACAACGKIFEGDFVCLSVRDQGQGINDATMERIFDPFFTTKGVGQGTGLGLAMVQGITHNHGGHIFCQSHPGQGASFAIYLPALEMDIQPSAPAAAPQAGAAPGGGETLLLVDDEKAILEAESRTLKNKGYRVHLAHSGEEALDLHESMGSQIDMVIMDLGMPGLGGYNCLVRLLARDPGLKVVIASGYAPDNQVQQALEAGASAYVAKPFKGGELLITIRRVLDGQEAAS